MREIRLYKVIRYEGVSFFTSHRSLQPPVPCVPVRATP